MGVCDSNINKNSSINHFQAIGNPETHGYRFEFKKEGVFNNNKKLNLKFIFYNFKIRYCISHKPTRDSTYITEIRIGQKIFINANDFLEYLAQTLAGLVSHLKVKVKKDDISNSWTLTLRKTR